MKAGQKGSCAQEPLRVLPGFNKTGGYYDRLRDSRILNKIKTNREKREKEH